MDYAKLAADTKRWGAELGFQAVGIADCDLSPAEPRLLEWLMRGWHGEMDYMARHGARRARPAELVPGTLSAICCRMNYASSLEDEWPAPADGRRACVARYARGRDITDAHPSAVVAERIGQSRGAFNYRAFADSAPVLEVAAAARLGWRGCTRCCWIELRVVVLPCELYTPICRCRQTAHRPITAVPAAPASTAARRRPLSRLTRWMRDAASPISPSS